MYSSEILPTNNFQLWAKNKQTTITMMDHENWEWPMDKYVNADLAFRRHKNLYDNNFSAGNCERCFGIGKMNAYCGRCYCPEQCVYQNRKLVKLNCPRIVQFTSYKGKYLFNELYVSLWLDAGAVRGIYPHDIMLNGDTTADETGIEPPPEFKDWRNIKFVNGGSVFTIIRSETPKLSAKMRDVYYEQVKIDF